MSTPITLDDVEVIYDEPPKQATRGRAGHWHTVIDTARAAAELADDKKKYAKDDGYPWTRYPKTGEPVVPAQTLYNLTNRFGEGSEHHTETGESFEVRLSDRVPSGEKGTSSKGVLWVRKVRVFDLAETPARAKTK